MGTHPMPPVPCRKFTGDQSPVKLFYCKCEAMRPCSTLNTRCTGRLVNGEWLAREAGMAGTGMRMAKMRNGKETPGKQHPTSQRYHAPANRHFSIETIKTMSTYQTPSPGTYSGASDNRLSGHELIQTPPSTSPRYYKRQRLDTTAVELLDCFSSDLLFPLISIGGIDAAASLACTSKKAKTMISVMLKGKYRFFLNMEHPGMADVVLAGVGTSDDNVVDAECRSALLRLQTSKRKTVINARGHTNGNRPIVDANPIGHSTRSVTSNVMALNIRLCGRDGMQQASATVGADSICITDDCLRCNIRPLIDDRFGAFAKTLVKLLRSRDSEPIVDVDLVTRSRSGGVLIKSLYSGALDRGTMTSFVIDQSDFLHGERSYITGPSSIDSLVPVDTRLDVSTIKSTGLCFMRNRHAPCTCDAAGANHVNRGMSNIPESNRGETFFYPPGKCRCCSIADCGCTSDMNMEISFYSQHNIGESDSLVRGAEVIAWAINHLLVECREDRYVYE